MAERIVITVGERTGNLYVYVIEDGKPMGEQLDGLLLPTERIIASFVVGERYQDGPYLAFSIRHVDMGTHHYEYDGNIEEEQEF